MPPLPIEVDAAAAPPLGMAPARFLRGYWQKRPLLIRNAFPAFEPPLQPEDLAGLACEALALSRIVEHDRDRDRWALRHGPFDEAMFPGLPTRDWTLLVQDVDKWDEDVRALLGCFDFLPSWRIDDVMVSFAAPGGSVGAHVDQYDVFLLQGTGRRRWQISTDAAAPQAFRDDVELKLLRRFAPTHEWVLAPGDMLYLPPGVPHHGEAVDACLTFSIGMRAPSAAELATDYAEFVAERLPESQRYADGDLAPARARGEIDAAALARAAAALQPLGTPAPDPATLREWFGRCMTRYRLPGELVPPTRTPSLPTLRRRVAAGTPLHRHPFARLAWTRQGRGALLFVNGEALPASLRAARAVCAADTLQAGSLQDLDAADWQLVHHLLRLGALVPGRRPRAQ